MGIEQKMPPRDRGGRQMDFWILLARIASENFAADQLVFYFGADRRTAYFYQSELGFLPVGFLLEPGFFEGDEEPEVFVTFILKVK